MDFEKVLEDALAAGANVSDLASKFVKVITKTLEEAEETRNKTAAREKMITQTKEALLRHVKVGRLDMSDATALIWLNILETTEQGKNMTSEDELKTLFSFVAQDIQHTLERYNEMDVEAAPKQKTERSPRQGYHGKHECKCQNKSDEEKITEFLKSLLS